MNLSFRAGDDVSSTVDFDTSLTGYTVTASMHSLVDQRKIADIPTVISNATSGVVTMTMPESTPGSYSWQMSWDAPGGLHRGVLAGIVDVVQ